VTLLGGAGTGALALEAEAGLGLGLDGPRDLTGSSGRTGRKGRPTKGREERGGSVLLRSNNDWVMAWESWEVLKLLSAASPDSRSRS